MGRENGEGRPCRFGAITSSVESPEEKCCIGQTEAHIQTHENRIGIRVLSIIH